MELAALALPTTGGGFFWILSASSGGLAGTPPWPPQGGAGDGSAAIVNGRVYSVSMRTQALRVTVGAYENSEWHVTLIQDTYTRGVLVNSELLVGPIYCARHQVERAVLQQLRMLMAREDARLALPATG